MQPYLLMAVLYLSLGVLAALDASLSSLGIITWFNGLRWLRVHVITLGVMTEAVFGLLPYLVASRAGRPRPAIRWDVWLALNAGLLTLLVGIPLVNGALILAGGTLIFIAALLLIPQLASLRPTSPRTPSTTDANKPSGRHFYIAGLSYLLLGIIIGSGLWLGWGQALRMWNPIEVHIHTNNWGFMSLVFAGLLVDLYPLFTHRSFAWPYSIRPIFWLMTLGALGLVLGPWVGSQWFTVPGLVLHLTGTLWLLANVIVPVWPTRLVRSPGIWHLVTSYVWILAPVFIAPLIFLNVPGFAGAGVEANAPQALIYGWVLQFGYALLPYLLRRALLPDEEARLGGNWFSLMTVHLGGVLLWASIFAGDNQTLLHGVAYVFWVLSMLPMTAEVWRIVRRGVTRLDTNAPSLASERAGGH